MFNHKFIHSFCNILFFPFYKHFWNSFINLFSLDIYNEQILRISNRWKGCRNLKRQKEKYVRKSIWQKNRAFNCIHKAYSAGIWYTLDGRQIHNIYHFVAIDKFIYTAACLETLCTMCRERYHAVSEWLHLIGGIMSNQMNCFISSFPSVVQNMHGETSLAWGVCHDC